LRGIALAAGCLFACIGPSGGAELYVREELRIPYAAAGVQGLEALLVRPNETGRFPLALISHGSPRSGADRPEMTPWSLLPQALEFARRGFAAAVVMRRGYGDSGGGWAEDYGGCRNPNYAAAGGTAAADLKAAVEFLDTRDDIDPSRAVAVGVSAGGFATVALTAEPPHGLVAAISFAGGRGSLRDSEVCNEDQLVEAFRAFGKRSRMPMLWVYAENDHFFAPELAERLKDAFIASGGNVDFIKAAAFEDDGHKLFSPAGIPRWTPLVDAFLQSHGLVPRRTLLPLPPPPVLRVPAVLGVNGRKAFDTYLTSPPHKAFAVSQDGYFGWRSGTRSTEAAKTQALQYCQANAKTCGIVFIDDAAVSK
jgi:dienelactone hydrolase